MGLPGRAIVASLLIVSAAVVVQRAADAESVPPRAPLASVPLSVAEWTGRDLPPWDEKILSVLGADEHINRRYFLAPRSEALASAPTIADLYVGYYRSQRQGDSIHSPQNCLPGAGWQPVSDQRVSIPVGRGTAIPVNRYVIQKDLDRQVVLYWFQGRGRVVANEYANRAYLVFDSLRTRRSGGALVRVMSPVTGSTEQASAAAASFVAAIYPRLSEVVP
jgi:EpsI family protein